MKSVFYLILFLSTTLLSAQPLSVSTTFRYEYEVRDENNIYPFIVGFNNLSNDINFDWQLPEQDKNGRVYINDRGLEAATQLYNYFSEEMVALDDRTTSVLLSRQCLRNLNANRSCQIEGKTIRKANMPTPLLRVHNQRLPNLVFAQGNGLKLWILDQANFPLIVRMEADFTIMLKTFYDKEEIFTDEVVTGDRELQISNKTNQAIYGLFIRPSGLTTWGENQNRLNNNNLVLRQDGVAKSIVEIGMNSCLFDIQGRGRNDAVIFTSMRTSFCHTTTFDITEAVLRGDNSRDPLPPPPVPDINAPRVVTVVNNTNKDIHFLYYKPAGTYNWSGNQTGRNSNPMVLGEYDTIELELRGGCLYDIKAEGIRQARLFELRNVDLCQNPAFEITDSVISSNGNSTPPRPTPVPNPPRPTPPNPNTNETGTLINRLSETVFYLYVRPAGTTDWGRDQNGTNGNDYTLAVGKSAKISLLQGCKFDIKGAGLGNKPLFEKMNIDLCRENPFTLQSTTNTQAPTLPNEIQIKNNSGLTVQNLFIKDASGTTNLMDFNYREHLFNAVLRPLAAEIYQPHDCNLDWIAFDERSNYIGLGLGQDICNLSATLNIVKLNDGLKVRNRLLQSVKSLQFSIGNDWSTDVLSSFSLSAMPTGQVRILPPTILGEGCTKNIKVTLNNNTVRTIRNVNTCSAEIVLQ